MCGGVTHNVAQLIMAAFVADTYSISYYMPFMIIGGLITGIIIGIIAMLIYNRCRNIN